MTQRYEGIVEHVYEDQVVVVYDVDGSVIEHQYTRKQFVDQVLPKVGARLSVEIVVTEIRVGIVIPNSEIDNSTTKIKTFNGLKYE